MDTVLKHIKRAPITIILVLANLAMMIVVVLQDPSFGGAIMLDVGASYTPMIIEQKEYYRLFTSMFLHFGVEHFASNMLLLFFLGEIVEPRLGKVKYLIVYLLGGMMGNVLSLVMDLRLPTSEMPVSAGASGAVFALIGAMAYLLIINKGRLAGVTLQRLMILIALSVWDGFRNNNIDGAAHIGGLIAGFLLTILLYRKSDANRRDDDEDNVYSNRQD